MQKVSADRRSYLGELELLREEGVLVVPAAFIASHYRAGDVLGKSVWIHAPLLCEDEE